MIESKQESDKKKLEAARCIYQNFNKLEI